MPENCNNAQVILPAPKFQHGDLVIWNIWLNNQLNKVCGMVTTRLYCETEANVCGYWEYIIQTFPQYSTVINGIFDSYESVTEHNLQPFVPSAVTTVGTEILRF